MTPGFSSRLHVGEDSFGQTLLRAVEPNGQETRESVHVRRIGIETVEVLASPTLLMGFAAGDILRVHIDGTFELLRCGPNACLRVFASPALTADKVERLRAAFDPLAGLVETPPDLRLAVLTVPWAAGAQRIKELIAAWADEEDARIAVLEWHFGNAAPEHEADS